MYFCLTESEPEFVSEPDVVYTVSKGDSVILNCEIKFAGGRNVSFHFE